MKGHPPRVWLRYSRRRDRKTRIRANGDLLGDMWLESVMTRGTDATFFPAEQLCKTITVELGGQQLDKLYSTWYRIYDNLYRNSETERKGYQEMTDFVDGEVDGTTKRFFTPILFWFSRGTPGNYLPLIALQYHELRVTFEFEDLANLSGIKSGTTLDATLWCDYVYLDQEERKLKKLRRKVPCGMYSDTMPATHLDVRRSMVIDVRG